MTDQPYTLTTDVVRDAYTDWEYQDDILRGADPAKQHAAATARGAEFDRWLAAHAAQVRADALRDAADRMNRPDSGCPYEVWASGAGDYLRAEADRITNHTDGSTT